MIQRCGDTDEITSILRRDNAASPSTIFSRDTCPADTAATCPDDTATLHTCPAATHAAEPCRIVATEDRATSPARVEAPAVGHVSTQTEASSPAPAPATCTACCLADRRLADLCSRLEEAKLKNDDQVGLTRGQLFKESQLPNIAQCLMSCKCSNVAVSR